MKCFYDYVHEEEEKCFGSCYVMNNLDYHSFGFLNNDDVVNSFFHLIHYVNSYVYENSFDYENNCVHEVNSFSIDYVSKKNNDDHGE